MDKKKFIYKVHGMVSGSLYELTVLSPVKYQEKKKTTDKIGMVIGNLLVVDELEEGGRWLCRCACGNSGIYSESYSEHTECKRCASANKRFGNLIMTRSNVNYRAAAENRCLGFELEDDVFIELISSNCYYCGARPQEKVIEDFITKVMGDSSDRGKIYQRAYVNGIDRVDNSRGYTIENCVPCCTACNYMKLNYTLNDFLYNVESIYLHRSRYTRKWEETKTSSHYKAFVELYNTYKYRANKKEFEFSLSKEDFSFLTRMNCHYCGRPPMQVNKRGGARYTYNGIDRVNSNKGYVLDNVVPCCSTCNYMKNTLTYNEFLDKVNKIYHNKHIT